MSTIEMHTGGEPCRIYVAGIPTLPGKTVLEKRRYFREHYDYIRTGTIHEPRGHADMYGAVITPSSEGDLDLFFLHNEGYSTMCGHAIIAVTTFVFEAGLVPRKNDNPRLTINVPAGRVYARATIEDGKVREVAFHNVDSFVLLRNYCVNIPAFGRITLDIAYGGAFYALVDAQALGLQLTLENAMHLIEWGRQIKHAIKESTPIRHPYEEELSFLYGTIFVGPARDSRNHSRNVCIFADGELDRSATGSGVSARAALLYANGELELGERITIESILGSTMTVQVEQETIFGPYRAVIPEVSGSAYITGRNDLYFDPEDPFCTGFLVR